MQLQPVRGTKDILPDDFAVFEAVLNKARKAIANYGYRECETPIFEFTEVFKRTLGDYSDIVAKEMYSFEDRSGQSITLRPELTAGITRAVLSNGMQQLLPLKLFTIGPNFRYERPQKGRQRQFNQISVEAVGYKDPAIDAETIILASQLLSELNILNKTSLEINTLGDKESRSNYLESLTKYLTKYKSDLSEDSKIRLEKNPLRILDSKDENDKRILEEAPLIDSALTDYARNFFDRVLSILTKVGIEYKINHKIVRGLDYYSHTAFEFVTSELGAQGTVLGGGRYDDLYKILGNQDIAAIGFAMGVERAVELYKLANPAITPQRGTTIISLTDKTDGEALLLAHQLRGKGLLVHFEQNNNPSKALKKAIANNSKLVIIIGEDEMNSGQYKVKDLDARSEETLPINQLVNYVAGYEF